jgi:hypothetical protein
VQALKNVKDPIEVLFVKPDTIIGHSNLTQLSDWCAASQMPVGTLQNVPLDGDYWCDPLLVELQRITKEILE